MPRIRGLSDVRLALLRGELKAGNYQHDFDEMQHFGLMNGNGDPTDAGLVLLATVDRREALGGAKSHEYPLADAALIAKRFHEAYEKLAPMFRYKTRDESAVPWAEVPDVNRSLMITAVGEAMLIFPPIPQEVVDQFVARELHIGPPAPEFVKSDDWQPIETAPMDGTSVMVYGEGFKWPVAARHGGQDWLYSFNLEIITSPPTHWQPILLPEVDRG